MLLHFLGAFIALCLVSPTLAEIHIITQVNQSYQPANVIILPGDTVRWVWTDGVHTVTSGTGAVAARAVTICAPQDRRHVADLSRSDSSWTKNLGGEES